MVPFINTKNVHSLLEVGLSQDQNEDIVNLDFLKYFRKNYFSEFQKKYFCKKYKTVFNFVGFSNENNQQLMFND